MSDRFDLPQGTRFNNIPTYAAMPLGEITQLAMMKGASKQHASNQAMKGIGDASSAFNKLEVAPFQVGLKKQFIEEHQKAIAPYIERLTRNPLDREANAQLENITSQFANSPIVNSFKINNEKYKTHKVGDKDIDNTYELDPEDKFGTGYKQDYSGKILDRKVTPHSDINEEWRKQLGHLQENGQLDSWIDTNRPITLVDGQYKGFVKGSDERREVNINQLHNAVQNSLPVVAQSDAGKYELQKALKAKDPYSIGMGNEVHNWDYDKLNEEVQKGNMPSYMLNNFEGNLINKGISIGSPQLHGTVNTKRDVEIRNNQDYKDDKKKKASQALNQSLEGETLDLTSPEFKAGKDKGLFSQDENGKISVNWTKTHLGTDFSTGTTLPKFKIEQLNKEDHESIDKVIRQAINTIGEKQIMNLLGKDISKINSNDYNTILNTYNELNKARAYNGNFIEGSELNAINKEVLTHPENYDFLDDKLQKTKDAQSFKGNMYNKKDYDFNVGQRFNINGKSYLKATLTNKSNGETISSYIRPNTAEFNNHFDEPAKVSKAISDAYSSGKKLKESKDLDNYLGYKVVTEVPVKDGKITVYKNPETDEEEIVKYDDKNNKLIKLGKSFKEYQQGVHLSYGNTKEGAKMYENDMTKKQAIEQNVNTEDNE